MKLPKTVKEYKEKEIGSYDLAFKYRDVIHEKLSKYTDPMTGSRKLYLAAVDGLCRAAKLYKAETEKRFETYASWFIREEIEKELNLIDCIRVFFEDKTPFLKKLPTFIPIVRTRRWLSHKLWKATKREFGEV